MEYSAKYDIDVNYPVLVDSIKHLYEQDINGWYLELLDLKSILPEFYNELEKQFDSEITVTRLFVTSHNTFSTIHRDEAYKWALNIPITGCKGSYNVWYELPKEVESIFSGKNDAEGVKFAANNSGAKVYKLGEIGEATHRVELNEPMIFNADIPHNVITDRFGDGELRVVLSVRFKTGKTQTFQETCKQMGI